MVAACTKTGLFCGDLFSSYLKGYVRYVFLLHSYCEFVFVALMTLVFESSFSKKVRAYRWNRVLLDQGT